MQKLSFSSLNTYNDCGEKYRLHYIEKLRPKKTKSALLFGKAIDDALNTLLETKDIKLAKKVFRHSWREQKINGNTEKLYYSENVKYSKADLDESLIPDRKTPLKNKEWTSMFFKGLIILDTYNKEILPKIKSVVSVQREASFEINEFKKITGFVDTIIEWEDGNLYIADHKTTSVNYTENSANESKQLSLYFLTQKKEYPNLNGLMFIVLDKKVRKRTKDVKTQIIFGKPNKNSIIELMNEFDTMSYNVETQRFTQNKDNCYGKYGKCDYYEYCHFNTKKHLIKV
jgi:RecB family exonuclease